MELNACGIRAPYDVPIYKMQHPIDIYKYIIVVAKSIGETAQPKYGYGGNILKYTYQLKDNTSKN